MWLHLHKADFLRLCVVNMSCGHTYVKWDPFCHKSACSWVVVGGDSLQLWRVAENILDKQSWTAGKGWFYRSGLCQGAENSLL
jgi:hypothetical protein